MREAADLFLPIHARTNGLDGWVSLEVSPRLAHDMDSTLAQAKKLHAQVAHDGSTNALTRRYRRLKEVTQ